MFGCCFKSNQMSAEDSALLIIMKERNKDVRIHCCLEHFKQDLKSKIIRLNCDQQRKTQSKRIERIDTKTVAKAIEPEMEKFAGYIEQQYYTDQQKGKQKPKMVTKEIEMQSINRDDLFQEDLGTAAFCSHAL